MGRTLHSSSSVALSLHLSQGPGRQRLVCCKVDVHLCRICIRAIRAKCLSPLISFADNMALLLVLTVRFFRVGWLTSSGGDFPRTDHCGLNCFVLMCIGFSEF